MKYFHYVADDGTLLRVKASRKPSRNTKPKRGTWIVREYAATNKQWVMPVFPEILWKDLKYFRYLGSIPVS